MHRWIWIIPILLLAIVAAGRLLNSYSFYHDEAWTMMYSGARNYGPLSIVQALAAQQEFFGDQAFGWTILVNRWGSLAGWNTIAVRSLAYFFGLLALALIYRAGKGMFGHAVGAGACLLLLGSSLPFQYFHIARTYTAVLCFSTVLLFSYWRLAFCPRPAGQTWWAGLLLGGIGLIYSHYYAALMVPALGIFHLFFSRRSQSWRKLLLAILLVALTSLPELTSIRRGVQHNIDSWGDTAMSVPDALLRLLNVMTTGVVRLPRLAGAFALMALAVSSLALYVTRPRRGSSPSAIWYLGVMVLVFFLLVMGADHFVRALLPSRARYLMALWPPALLLISAGIWHLGRIRQRLADWLLAGLVFSGLTFVLHAPLSAFQHEISYIHLADQALGRQAQAEDYLLVLEETLPNDIISRNFYLHVQELPLEIVTEATDAERIAQQSRANSRVWLLATGPDSAIEHELSKLMRFCRRPVRRGDLVLTLYASSEADCA